MDKYKYTNTQITYITINLTKKHLIVISLQEAVQFLCEMKIKVNTQIIHTVKKVCKCNIACVFVFLACRQIYDDVVWETISVYTQDPFEVTSDFAHMLNCDSIWTLFLRRISNAVDFNQNWDNYVKGFGNIHENFWLGLENIHQSTSVRGNNVLRVYLESFDDGK